ncbi:hypothetical protein XI04_03325 [Bradyrhizobium sp. CCBAU 11430]|uniref:LodA/GoxA family CTQ-dependent oxidase n=1 Tax=Bradyrhizobium sp. CCBAU 11430 TaxID=1630881 RepID=UPI002305A6C8|nr:LodA/GoxA family CTQ-dependent oxidase [Bradyrhizobium sp. CCBAU 11430]MDA9512103.1 hypothetical protein [Bradyrhizobium sp. CCBAU 11430]
MPYAIYPPIGLARLGNSPEEFFVGREEPDGLGLEINADGSERPVTRFKDMNFRMKRQGARFRIFDVTDPAAPIEANLPLGTVVRWTVTLCNRKDAIQRPGGPPAQPRAVIDDPARLDRAMLATANVSGANAARVAMGASYRAVAVNLGHLLTDRAQRLIVLGGSGRSESPDNAPIGDSFYNNPGWFDDVADGPVMATIQLPNQQPVDAVGAWVIVGPPDFAPPANGVVNLYDVIRQVAIDQHWLQAPAPPYFDTDIRPMIARASSLQHVDPEPTWPTISQDWAALSDASAAFQPLRETTATLVREVENAFHDFELRTWQIDALDSWAAGQFRAGAAPSRGLCDTLTRAALDGALGQGFFPGIEAGINITDPGRYENAAFEFRLSHQASRAGDLTALMALPWQADFLKCGDSWWPAQRPYRVLTEENVKRPWLRPAMDHSRLAKDVQKLGVMTPTGGQVVEKDRDPALDSQIVQA